MTKDDQFLDTIELARALKVRPSWVRDHAAPSSKNRIPVKKVGRLIRFDLGEVLAWIDKQGDGNR